MKIRITHGDKIYEVPVKDGVSWTTERKGVPGKLAFTVISDGIAVIDEGDAVSFTDENKGIFFGFVFTAKRDQSESISVTAYDQLRYLKNKDTLEYNGLLASQVVQRLGNAYRLNLGTIEPTTYCLPKTVEEDSTLFDIILNALDGELMNAGRMYILYDDFGKLTLKSLENMKTDVVIDDESAEKFSYTTSIDNKVYNRIKLKRDNESTGMVDTYIAQDSSNINRWGVLQLTEKLKEGENGVVKANALLSLYNSKSRSLKITGCKGDLKVRAGSLVVVVFELGDGTELSQYMLVDVCKHVFKESSHTMDLTLIGGGING